MSTGETSYIFGPVPSRRLGKSLGINNIPAKHCTYACLYCQVGTTTRLMANRCPFHAPEQRAKQVCSRLERIPTRPPMDASVCAPDEATLNGIYQFLVERVDRVACPGASGRFLRADDSALWGHPLKCAEKSGLVAPLPRTYL